MAQIHVHSSEQREPQKSGIRGPRRIRDGVSARDVEEGSGLPCEARIARNDVASGDPGRLGVRRTLACFQRASLQQSQSGSLLHPVLGSEPTFWTLLQFLEADHAHA